jgi:hypothetical protein
VGSNLIKRVEKLEISAGGGGPVILVLDLWPGEDQDRVLAEYLEEHPEHKGVEMTFFIRKFSSKPLGTKQVVSVYPLMSD